MSFIAPIVSVLMTAFNRELYIAAAIRSVLSSTFEDFELLILDDCSTDKTLEIAKHFESLDKRIKVFVNDVNLGDYPNRNKIASLANGKYIKYLDSDDLMMPNCLDVMVIEMERHQDCAFGISSRSLLHTIIHRPEFSFRTHFFERGILDMSPSGSIIKRDIFIKENGFLELRCVSDFEFWMRLALKYSILEMPSGLIYWREHEGQEIRLGNTEYLKFSLTIINEKISKSNLLVDEKIYIIQSLKKGLMRYMIKNFIKIGFSNFFYFKNVNKLSFIHAFK